MNHLFNSIKRIKYYVLICLLALGGYVWAGIMGYKIIGDDNESAAQASGNSHGNRFYHK